MFRSMISTLVILGASACFVTAAQERTAPQGKTDKDAKEGEITKMDAKKGNVTLKMHDKDKGKGKEIEKTFKLAKDIEYMDSKGKAAKVDHFTAGDLVLINEHAGEITKMKKETCEATITKVDAKKGTVTVKMHEKDREIEKTFRLAEDIEYMDSTGKVATINIFTSGDQVLVVEHEGMIAKMKKHDKSDSKKKSDGK